MFMSESGHAPSSVRPLASGVEAIYLVAKLGLHFIISMGTSLVSQSPSNSSHSALLSAPTYVVIECHVSSLASLTPCSRPCIPTPHKESLCFCFSPASTLVLLITWCKAVVKVRILVQL